MENYSNFKYLRFMSMLYITVLLAATVVAYKIDMLKFIPVAGSTLVFTSSYFLGDVIAEVYGYKISKRLIWESVVCGYIFAFAIALVIALPSPGYWARSQSYNMVFGHIIRFTNAGTLGYLISAFLNVYIISKWKVLVKGKHFWLRSLGATSIGEAAANCVSYTISFFGLIPSKHILMIMLSAYLFKLAYGVVAVWPAMLLTYFLKKQEGDFYDVNTDFNPFKLGMS